MFKITNKENTNSGQLIKVLKRFMHRIEMHESNVTQLNELVNNEERRLSLLNKEYIVKTRELAICQMKEAMMQTIRVDTEFPIQLTGESIPEFLGDLLHEEF